MNRGKTIGQSREPADETLTASFAAPLDEAEPIFASPLADFELAVESGGEERSVPTVLALLVVLELELRSRSKSLGSMHTKSLAAIRPSQKRRCPPKPAIVSRALPVRGGARRGDWES